MVAKSMEELVSLCNLDRPLEITNFLNSSINLSGEILDMPSKFFLITLKTFLS